MTLSEVRITDSLKKTGAHGASAITIFWISPYMASRAVSSCSAIAFAPRSSTALLQ